MASSSSIANTMLTEPGKAFGLMAESGLTFDEEGQVVDKADSRSKRRTSEPAHSTEDDPEDNPEED